MEVLCANVNSGGRPLVVHATIGKSRSFRRTCNWRRINSLGSRAVHPHSPPRFCCRHHRSGVVGRPSLWEVVQ